MAYRICPECGAYLDPGERCDCQGGGEEWPVEDHSEKERTENESLRRSCSNMDMIATVAAP